MHVIVICSSATATASKHQHCVELSPDSIICDYLAAMSTYPLYDSTFQLFRLSALYDGSSPVLDNLNLHARKLKGALNGDSSLRLSAASVLDDRKTGLGNLKSCSWGLLGDEAQWQRSHEEEDDDDEISMVRKVFGQLLDCHSL